MTVNVANIRPRPLPAEPDTQPDTQPEAAPTLRARLRELIDAAKRRQGMLVTFDEPLESLRARRGPLEAIVATVDEVKREHHAAVARWAEGGCEGDAPDFTAKIMAAERAADAAKVQLEAIDKAAASIQRSKAQVVEALHGTEEQARRLAVEIAVEDLLALGQQRIALAKRATNLEQQLMGGLQAIEKLVDRPTLRQVSDAILAGDQRRPEVAAVNSAKLAWSSLLEQLAIDPAAQFSLLQPSIDEI